jgi:hypothetical protein
LPTFPRSDHIGSSVCSQFGLRDKAIVREGGKIAANAIPYLPRAPRQPGSARRQNRLAIHRPSAALRICVCHHCERDGFEPRPRSRRRIRFRCVFRSPRSRAMARCGGSVYPTQVT